MEISLPFRHELDRVDDATATLILQLQNRDIEELVQSRKGKGRDGEISDADLAIATYSKSFKRQRESELTVAWLKVSCKLSSVTLRC